MGFKASVHREVWPHVEALLAQAEALRLKVERLENGTTLVDAGLEVRGGLEAGRQIAEICMGGLGTVSFQQSAALARWPLWISVHAKEPVLACLGSQYAGWSLSHGKGKEGFYALGSGPARALAVKEALFEELGYRDQASQTVIVMEVDKRPPLPLLDKIAEDCGVASDNLVVIITPTTSLAGNVQVVARVLEVALHKVHELEFPLEKVVDGFGSAPLPPPAASFIKAMGRTNDAILFAGQVHLFVEAEDEEAKTLAERLPSSTSCDYGKPFAEVFKEYNYDFFKIDPMLFSPAQVAVTNLKTGKTFHAGRIDPELIERSFNQ